MKSALGILLLALATLLQVTLAERITLLNGPANLVLLVMLSWNLHENMRPNWRWGLMAGLMLSLFTVLPVWVLLLGYASASALAQYLQQNVWQSPLLTLFTSLVVGTLIIDGITLIYLWLSANPLDLFQAFNLVTLPSIVLNMILALPVFTLINEFSKLLLPSEVNP